MHEHYTPTQQDILWMQQVVRVVVDGGVWAFPGALLMYTINKRDKLFLLMNPEQLDNADSRFNHERTIIVMSHLGYRVMPNTIDPENFVPGSEREQ